MFFPGVLPKALTQSRNKGLGLRVKAPNSSPDCHPITVALKFLLWGKKANKSHGGWCPAVPGQTRRAPAPAVPAPEWTGWSHSSLILSFWVWKVGLNYKSCFLGLLRQFLQTTSRGTGMSQHIVLLGKYLLD